MDMQRVYRRDNNSRPNTCNNCGQVGHYAAQCPQGSQDVDFHRLYGQHAFVMRQAVFQSDLDAAKQAKKINFDHLEKKAKEYAEMRKEAFSKQEEMRHAAEEAQQMVAEARVPPPAAAAAAATTTTTVSGGGEAAAAQPMEAATTAQQPQCQQSAAAPLPMTAAAPGQLPLGWASAKDAQNRTYFYHTQTKKVQWRPPTAETPIT